VAGRVTGSEARGGGRWRGAGPGKGRKKIRSLQKPRPGVQLPNRQKSAAGGGRPTHLGPPLTSALSTGGPQGKGRRKSPTEGPKVMTAGGGWLPRPCILCTFAGRGERDLAAQLKMPGKKQITIVGNRGPAWQMPVAKGEHKKRSHGGGGTHCGCWGAHRGNPARPEYTDRPLVGIGAHCDKNRLQRGGGKNIIRKQRTARPPNAGLWGKKRSGDVCRAPNAKSKGKSREKRKLTAGAVESSPHNADHIWRRRFRQKKKKTKNTVQWKGRRTPFGALQNEEGPVKKWFALSNVSVEKWLGIERRATSGKTRGQPCTCSTPRPEALHE